jgi:hypothetical protein
LSGLHAAPVVIRSIAFGALSEQERLGQPGDFGQQDVSVPVFDSMAIHTEAAVNYVLGAPVAR